MTTSTDLQVYQPWSEEAVREALSDFKREMYDGAGVTELHAGMRCLDFLTLRSELSDELREDIDNTTEQANMRIQLMLAQSDDRQADPQALERTLKGVEGLRQMVKSFRDRFLGGRIGYAGDPYAIHQAIEERVRRRLLATA